MLVLDMLFMIKTYIFRQDKLAIRLLYPLVNTNKVLSFNISFYILVGGSTAA